MPGSHPVSTSNGRLEREVPLAIGERPMSLTAIALRSAVFAGAWRVRIESVRPLTWIKGGGGQGATIPRAITYAVSAILLTVFRYFAKLLTQ